MVLRIAGLKVGDLFDDETDIGSMVSDGQPPGCVSGWMRPWPSGAIPVTGGRDRRHTLAHVGDPASAGMQVVDDEIFGPVAVIVEHSGDEEAVRLANATPFGLQFGVFTRSLERALRSIAVLESGSVIVNRSSNYRLEPSSQAA